MLLSTGPAHASPYSAKDLKATMHAMNVSVSREQGDSTIVAARLGLPRSVKREKKSSVAGFKLMSIVLQGDSISQLHAAVTKWRAVEAESESISVERQLQRGHMSIIASKMGKQLNRISKMDSVQIDPSTRSITGRNADGLVRTAQVDGSLVTRGVGTPTSDRGWGQQSQQVTFTIGERRWPKAFKRAQARYIAEKMDKPGATFNVAKPGDKVVATTYGDGTRYEVTRFGQKVAEFAATE